MKTDKVSFTSAAFVQRDGAKAVLLKHPESLTIGFSHALDSLASNGAQDKLVFKFLSRATKRGQSEDFLVVDFFERSKNLKSRMFKPMSDFKDLSSQKAEQLVLKIYERLKTTFKIPEFSGFSPNYPKTKASESHSLKIDDILDKFGCE